MGQDTDGINLMNQSHLGCSRSLRARIDREWEKRDHPASSMNFEGVRVITNSGYQRRTAANSGEQRVHTFSREHARQCISHASYSCICICIIDACKVIRTRCTCVYIFTYVCKCTRYNMHYRSRAMPRQFSTSLRFGVPNQNCRAGVSPL